MHENLILFQTNEMKELFLKSKKKYWPYMEESIFLFEKLNYKEIIKLIISKNKNGAIFIKENGTIEFVHKKRGTWSNYDKSMYYMHFLEKNLVKPSNYENVSKLIQFGKPNDDVFFENGEIVLKGEQLNKNLEPMIRSLYLNNWFFNIEKTVEKRGFFKTRYTKFQIFNEEFVSKFFEDLNKGKKIKGVPYTAVISNEGYKNFDIKFNGAIMNVKIKDGKIELFLLAKKMDDIDLHYFCNGLIANIKNIILMKSTYEDIKIKKKDIIISSIGILIFILLSILTFTVILNPKDVSKSFEILFYKETLLQPWIYLLWVNFVITFFWSFIIMYTVSYIVNGRRPNINTVWSYFVAAQLKATTRFITGEAIIGTILWAWYIVKNTDIKVSSLVGNLSSFSTISAFTIFFVAIPFVIIGQSYIAELLSNNYVSEYLNIENSSQIMIIFSSLAWGGLIWSLIHHLSLSLIIFFAPALYMYNYIYTKIAFYKNDYRVSFSMDNRDYSLRNTKRSFKKVFKNKDRIFRVFLSSLLMIFFESFESMFIFKIVENYNYITSPTSEILNSYGISAEGYNNFIQLSGVRIMSSNTHNFPILNIAPGNGLAVVEYFMSNTNSIIFVYTHPINNASISNDEYLSIANSFGDRTAFITRFFNVYLQRGISMLLTLKIIITLITNKTRGKV